MSARTGIQWTDATWNPVVGCTKVSQGCKNCYAKELHDKRHKAHRAGKSIAPQYAQPFEKVQLMYDRLSVPLHRHIPTRYFVNSVSDLFHDDVPDDFLVQVFDVMRRCGVSGGSNTGLIRGEHTFQILTKRPERMRDFCTRLRWDGERLFLERDADAGRPVLPMMRNVWLGVSVENQEAADERIAPLLQTPAAVCFLSCEPLLGRVSLRWASWAPLNGQRCDREELDGVRGLIDWVIIGGESGKGARRFELSWAETLIEQCQAAGIAVFMKQIGAVTTLNGPDFTYSLGGDLGDMERWPNQFRVREFPASEVPA